jgi:hypothetical protein
MDIFRYAQTDGSWDNSYDQSISYTYCTHTDVPHYALADVRSDKQCD